MRPKYVRPDIDVKRNVVTKQTVLAVAILPVKTLELATLA